MSSWGKSKTSTGREPPIAKVPIAKAPSGARSHQAPPRQQRAQQDAARRASTAAGEPTTNSSSTSGSKQPARRVPTSKASEPTPPVSNAGRIVVVQPSANPTQRKVVPIASATSRFKPASDTRAAPVAPLSKPTKSAAAPAGQTQTPAPQHQLQGQSRGNTATEPVKSRQASKVLKPSTQVKKVALQTRNGPAGSSGQPGSGPRGQASAGPSRANDTAPRRQTRIPRFTAPKGQAPPAPVVAPVAEPQEHKEVKQTASKGVVNTGTKTSQLRIKDKEVKKTSKGAMNMALETVPETKDEDNTPTPDKTSGDKPKEMDGPIEIKAEPSFANTVPTPPLEKPAMTNGLSAITKDASDEVKKALVETKAEEMESSTEFKAELPVEKPCVTNSLSPIEEEASTSHPISNNEQEKKEEVEETKEPAASSEAKATLHAPSADAAAAAAAAAAALPAQVTTAAAAVPPCALAAGATSTPSAAAPHSSRTGGRSATRIPRGLGAKGALNAPLVNAAAAAAPPRALPAGATSTAAATASSTPVPNPRLGRSSGAARGQAGMAHHNSRDGTAGGLHTLPEQALSEKNTAAQDDSALPSAFDPNLSALTDDSGHTSDVSEQAEDAARKKWLKAYKRRRNEMICTLRKLAKDAPRNGEEWCMSFIGVREKKMAAFDAELKSMADARGGMAPNSLLSIDEIQPLHHVAMSNEMREFLASLRNPTVLGSGFQGTVYKAFYTKRRIWVAVKLAFTTEENDNMSMVQALNEMEKLRHLGPNRHTLQLIDAVHDDVMAVTVLELCEGGDLWKGAYFSGHFIHKGKVPVKKIQNSLFDALIFLHSKGIAHRDFKPENILIDAKGDVKIADFGLAVFRKDFHDIVGDAFGTPEYMAPEIFDGRYDERRNEFPAVFGASDVWALTVMVTQMLSGVVEPVPHYDDQNELLDGFMKKVAPFRATWGHNARAAASFRGVVARKRHLSRGAKQLQKTQPRLAELFTDVLCSAPKDRPTATELRQRVIACDKRASGW